MRRELKIGALAACAVVLAVFAYLRVRPYMSSHIDGKPGLQHIVRKDVGVLGRTPDRVGLGENREELRQALFTSVSSALEGMVGIDGAARLDARSIDMIAGEFADYVMLARAGTHAEYTEWTASAGRKEILPAGVTDRELYWDIRTVWARHGEIDPSGVSAGVLYINGIRATQAGAVDFSISGPARTLPGGGLLFVNDHEHTVIEISLTVSLPTASGQDDVDGRVGVVFVRSGRAGWTPVQVLLHDVPAGLPIGLSPI